jgi:hypothetical protein
MCAAVFGHGEAEISLLERCNRTGVVDGLTIHLHPLPNLLQSLVHLLWHLAGGIGADTEQQIAPFGYNLYQGVYGPGG